MNIKLIFTIVEIILSLILTFLILSQNQGSGLSLVFGGSNTFYRSKRGVEKLFFISTIVGSILFVVNSFIIFLI